MTHATLALHVREQTLVLHPERAVEWLERRTLIVADTHFGKSSMFRAHGFAVPAGSDERDRLRLTRLVERTGAQRLIILGDFLHAPLAADSDDARELESWSTALRATDIHVVAGNHDRGALQHWCPPVRWLEGELLDAPFRFTHDASQDSPAGAGSFTLSGHIHPVYRLRGLRQRGARVPIFWRREAGLVLPSFGEFTGGYVVAPAAGDGVFAAGPQGVVAFKSSAGMTVQRE